jgi:hypothetical protein
MGGMYHYAPKPSLTLLITPQTKLIDEDEARAGGPAEIEIKPEVETKPSRIKKSDSPVKKRTKTASRDSKQPPKKRQKKEESSSDGEISGASTEESISDFNGSDDSDAPKPKKRSKPKSKARSKPQSKKRAKVESDESEEDTSEPSFVDSDESENKPRQPKQAKREIGTKARPSKSKVESDDESEEDQIEVQPAPTKVEHQRHSSAKVESADEKSAIEDEDSDSEAAMMIDEKPKPKQKRRSKSEASSSSKASKPKPAAKELSADDAQIKTLQSQLMKCGVRKIWGFELKRFGDDNKQKIRHLQGMLRDVGMTGRFSEQRAKEIKELRELQADLEAVQEGDSKWGLQSGKRARGQRKVLKELSDDDVAEDDDGDSVDDGGDTKKNIKGEREKVDDKAARVKQELAFLGDEESDSD